MARLEIDIIGRDRGFLTTIKKAEEAIDRLNLKAKELGKTKIGFNTAEAVSSIRKVNTLLKETQTRIKEINSKQINISSGGSGGAGGVGSIIGQLTKLAASYMTLEAAIRAMKAAFDISLKTDALDASFNFIFEDGTKRIENLRKEANRLGVDFLTLAETNKKFMAAAKASNFDLERAEEIFNSVANAGAKLKLSNEQIGGTFLAIEQMISKGTVSMEELRRQLGDRLPGAFALAAKAMGMTEARFNKAVANGEVMAKDLLPLLAKELDKTYGNDKYKKIESLQASTNGLNNTMIELVTSSKMATIVFKPFIDTVNSLVRTIFLLDSTTRSAVDRFKDSEGAFISNEKELKKLIARQEELRGKTNLNSEEQKELKNIVNQISRILPQAVTEWDKYGNAISFSTDKVNELLKANRNLIADMKKEALSGLNEDAKKYSTSLKVISQQLQQMSDKGVETMIDFVDPKTGYTRVLNQKELQKQAEELRERLANTYLDIRDLTGQLRRSQVDFLENNGYQFYINRAKSDVKSFEDALKAIKNAMSVAQLDQVRIDFAEFDGTKKFEDAIKARLKEIEKAGKDALKTAKDMERAAEAVKGAFKNLDNIARTANVSASEDPTAGIVENYKKMGEDAFDAYQEALKNKGNPEQAFELYFKAIESITIAKAAEIAKKTAEELDKKTKEHISSLDVLDLQMDRKANQGVVEMLTKRLNDEYKLKVKAYNDEKNLAKKTQEEINADQKAMQENYWQEFSSIELIDNVRKAGVFALKESLKNADIEYQKYLDKIKDPKKLDEAIKKWEEFKSAIRIESKIDAVQGIENISRELQSVISSFESMEGSLGRSLQAISDIVGALGSIGKNLSSLGSKFGESLSSPKLGIAGAVLGVAGSLINAISQSRKKAREEEEAMMKEFNDYYKSLISGELNYQALLRKRRYTDAISNSGYSGIKSGISAQVQNLKEIEKEYNSLFDIISKGYAVVGKKLEVYRNKKFFDFFGDPVKFRFVDIKEALFGRTFEELEQMDLKGMLTGVEKEDFDKLKALREELLETGKSIEDLQRELSELLTGTNLEQLASGFVDLFKSGKTSAKDFADYTQEVIRNAMVSSFIAKYAAKMMEPFFNELSAQMDSGDYDYNSLQKLGQEAGNNITEGLRAMEKAMGIKLFDNLKGTGITSEIGRLITEETANKLEGIQRAQFEQAKITNAYLKQMLSNNYTSTGGFDKELARVLNDNMISIVNNTREIADNTSVLPNMDKTLTDIGSSINQIVLNSRDQSERDLGV